MNKLKQLIAKMEACHAEATTYLGKAEASTDAEKAKQFMGMYQAKMDEFTELQGKVAIEKQLVEASDAIASAKSLTVPNRAGMNLDPEDDEEGDEESDDDDKGQARGKTAKGKKKERHVSAIDKHMAKSRHFIEVDTDPVRDRALKKSFFMDWVAFGAKALDGNQYEAIRAKQDRFTKISDESVMLPPDLSMLLRAKQRTVGGYTTLYDGISGKVILSTDAMGNPTDSGAFNLVAPDFRPQLLALPVTAPTIYDFARLIPAVNGAAEWPMLDQAAGDYGGVAFTWKGTEGADKGETEPKFKDFSISTNELSGWTETSLTVLRRSALDLEGIIMQLFRDACRAEWSKKMLHGSGSNEPLGVLHASSGITAVSRATASQVKWADLTNLEYGIPMALRFGARYVLIDPVEKYLKQTLDSTGRPIFTADVHSQIKNLLAGYGYTAHAYGPSTINSAGDIMMGNFNYYGWAIEEDIAIARSEHAEFKKGRVVFRLMCFVGGKPIYPTAFTKLSAG